MSTKRDNGGPAFPMPECIIEAADDLLKRADLPPEVKSKAQEEFGAQACGMTLRDYFAAKAMQGLLAGPDVLSPSEIATLALQHADAMLVEREKP